MLVWCSDLQEMKRLEIETRETCNLVECCLQDNNENPIEPDEWSTAESLGEVLLMH